MESSSSSDNNKRDLPDENVDLIAKKVKTEDDVKPENVQENNSDNNKSQIKKRKYALAVGYCGEGYFGLQRNSSLKGEKFRTIEDEIVDNLVKLNAIPQQHADEMFKMSFQRAARTDKGVSAAENLISLKMELADDTIPKLNEMLPKQIRVFGYNKVTQSFDAKNNCDGRTYVYILPTFAFCPIDEILTEKYRMPEDVLKKVNHTLKLLTGTHNFHNFTSGRKFTDPSAKRFIINFECSEPFIKDDCEFAVIKVRGQSFMLNQIRKMIGLVIAIVRGLASEENLELCWTANKVDVPKAPALGLMLDKLHYDKYNRKFGKDGIHKPIDWSEYHDEIEKFKFEYIFSHMIKKEITEKSMFKWLSRLPICHFGILHPNFVTGYYTGIGKANYLLEKLNQVPASKDDDDSGVDD